MSRLTRPSCPARCLNMRIVIWLMILGRASFHMTDNHVVGGFSIYLIMPSWLSSGRGRMESAAASTLHASASVARPPYHPPPVRQTIPVLNRAQRSADASTTQGVPKCQVHLLRCGRRYAQDLVDETLSKCLSVLLVAGTLHIKQYCWSHR